MRPRTPVLLVLGAATCVSACSSGAPAARPSGSSCVGGIYWRDQHWLEHDVGRFRTGAELTDEGQYPGCHDVDPQGGFATDTYRIEDVPTSLAVAGLREDSDTYVVYVRSGVDPDRVARLLARH